ncbi:hypothetical protein E3Q19_02761 [Wallemia mellicola]|nr:hypothetical protein E3Q21_03529 [Wallemia mellicola]TIB84950.1 hypothetical protein E3Q20_03456 [Wallemia mellicola]TIB90266.1 hypothetical protein E3Q19_02761 [Wallemia mellicola]TIC03162.1 hypothetical protein E3Q16_03201 [Wallemia mellicola]TIC12688.1 hypothetical protein E3Q13_04110 [Wallemia mellicola]
MFTRSALRTLNRSTLRNVQKPRFLSTTIARLEANKVSHNPPSDNAQHAAQNAKEEVGKVAHEVGDYISGGQSASLGSEPHMHPTMGQEFQTMTRGLYVNIPRPAIYWGALGGVPYLGTAISHIYLSSQLYAANMGASGIDITSVTELLQQVETIQVGYGAAMLSFLGAIHWGMEFAEFGGKQGNNRYVVGVVPVVIAALSTLPGWQFAMIAQWTGFAYQWGVDIKLTQRGWTPHWFAAYRFWLTLAVGSLILLSLASSNYYTPRVGSNLQERRILQSQKTGKVEGHTKSESESEIDEDPSGNAFGVIKKKHEGGEGEEGKEGKEGEESEESKESKGENQSEGKGESNEDSEKSEKSE